MAEKILRAALIQNIALSSQKKKSELEILNLEDVVKRFAESMLDKQEKKEADLKNPIINWDFMLVTHGETKYVQMTDYAQPTAHVLFTANFINDTPKEKTYALRTERRTKSVCNLSFKRTYTFGSSLSLKIAPPTPVVGASVGFKKEIHKERGLSESCEQELVWSVDSQIEVPSGSQTAAELIIKEENYNGDFSILCTFEGEIVVTYEHKETKEHISTVTAIVDDYFSKATEFTKDNRGNPVFEVKGVCNCKYGIEQNVHLKESKITPPNADGN